jgi:PPP family 3-phenylpropionic acid transporter
LGALYSGYSWKLLGPQFTFGMASAAALAAAVIIALCSKDIRNDPG